MIQANKFMISGNILSESSPINLSDTTITAQANLHTIGITSKDIRYNMSGDIDVTFDNGTLSGLGIDEFYARAPNISRMNASDNLYDMSRGGKTKIKSMHVIGNYNNGVFKTTKLFTLGVVHSSISGNLEVSRGVAAISMNILLRGTAPEPKALQLQISNSGNRNFSLDDAIMNIDPEYTREFILTHDKF